MLKILKNKPLKNNTKIEQSPKNKNTQKQRGRSMVEMLGVLAIIGVLSIGGIQGYTMAMRKYKANEILSVANKYAMVKYAQCQNLANMNPEKYGLGKKAGFSWGNKGIVPYGEEKQNGSPYIDITNENLWTCPSLPFEQAGLGSLPAGAADIGWSTKKTPYNEIASSDWHDSDLVYHINDNQDEVRVPLFFTDLELCQSVASIGNVVQRDWSSYSTKNYKWGDCFDTSLHGDYGFYELVVSFKVN